MLAREEALSPILLPDSRLFKNQVSCTKARAAAQSRASMFTLQGSCLLSLRLLLSMARLLTCPPS